MTSFDYRYHRDGTLGYVELTGSKTFTDAIEMWERIRQTIEQENLDGVLVVDRTKTELTLDQVMDLEQQVTARGFPRGIRIAILPTEARTLGNYRFGETVARNRGWPRIAVFASEAEARAWLAAAPPDQPNTNG